MPRRLASPLRSVEAEVGPRAHLDRGAAGLAVALRVVHVAGRDQRALGVDRQQHGHPGGGLLDVGVAGGLAGRDGAQPLARHRAAGGHGALGVRRQGQAPALGERRLPLGGGSAQLGARRQAEGAEERVAAGCARPAAARTPRSRCRAAASGRCEGRGSRRAGSRSPEPGGCSPTESQGSGSIVEELGLEQVPGLRALDEHRPGQRVDRAKVRAGHVLRGRSRMNLAVEGVPRLVDHRLAGLDLQHRLDGLVPAVVPGLRLVGQGLATGRSR